MPDQDTRTRAPRVGVLPLYLRLLADAVAGMDGRLRSFARTIGRGLEDRGLAVVLSEPCALLPEAASAIRRFEDESLDAIVVLHLTYAPSLESADALRRTGLPIILLDTTPVADFARVREASQLLFNHGIHALQDLANVLLQNARPFEIVAGHWKRSDVLDRAAVLAKGFRMARLWPGLRIGRVGGPFPGMGDILTGGGDAGRALQATVVEAQPDQIARRVPEPADGQADSEVEEDRRSFDARRVDPRVHRESVRVGIGFRRWIEEERLDAFCFNPLSLHRSGLVPFAFLEASRSMARGIGYAGEGDVATAALMAAAFRSFPAAAFTEMFCPDWRRGRVLLSHTGESNPVVLAGRPRLVSKVHAVTGVVSAVCAGSLEPGPACLVNLSFSAPGDGPGFRVVVVRGDVQRDRPRGEMRNTIRGWFKPRMPFDEMLRAYSILGGSHHLVAVYGDVAEAFRVLAGSIGFDFHLVC